MRLFVVAALAAAFALPALADGPIELKLGVKKGDKITKITKGSGEGTLTVEAGEQKQELGVTSGQDGIEVEEVLEAKDGKPTKVKRLYVQKFNRFEIPDMGQNNSTDSKLVGKILTVEEADGKVTATGEGADEKELEHEKIGTEIDEALLPGKPVNVGDSWEADKDKVKAAFGREEDEIEEATLSCKLEAVEEKFGQKCAKLTVKLATKGTTMANGQKMKQTFALEGPVWFGLTSGRALGMELKGKMKLSGSGGPQKIKVALEVTMNGDAKVGEADFTQKPILGAEDEGGEEEEEEENGGGMK